MDVSGTKTGFNSTTTSISAAGGGEKIGHVCCDWDAVHAAVERPYRLLAG